MPGVLDILTHENVGGEAKPPPPHGGGGETTTRCRATAIWHDGQIIGVVVADSFEAAREAALHGARSNTRASRRRATLRQPRRRGGDRASPASTRTSTTGDADARLRRGAGAGRRALRHADPAPQPDRALHHHLRVGRTAG